MKFKRNVKFLTVIFTLIFVLNITFAASASVNSANNEDSIFKSSLEPDIETYMRIGYASSPILSADGKTIYYFSYFTSGRQLLKMSEDNNYPVQVTFAKSGVRFPTLSPDGKWMIFLTDNDGDEQYQLNLLDLGTGKTEEITNQPEIQFSSVVWHPDSRKIYFRANMADPKDFHVYSMDLVTREIKKLWDKPGYFGPSDISKDGRYLLIYELSSSVDSKIHLLDLRTGKSRNLTAHKSGTRNSALTLSPDNRTLYYVTDDTPQGAFKLSAMDLRTMKSKVIFDADSNWDIDKVYSNNTRDVFAIVVNEEGYGPLTLFDVKANTILPSPKFTGITSSVSFSNGSKIAFDKMTSVKTTEVYTWDWKTGKLEQKTFSTYAGIDPNQFIEPQLIRYKSFDGLEIPAFVYFPPNWDKNETIPFIIDFHGGPASQSRPIFQRNVNYFLANGFGMMFPNVRGSSGYGREYVDLDNYKKRMDSVKDGYYAAKYLVEQGYAKQGEIGVKGGSYGGFMVMALITEYPEMWGAAYESVGIVDFENFLENTKDYRRALREAEYGPLTDREFLRSISPIYKLDRITTPLMVSHGVNDPRVPVSEAYLIINNLKDRGVAVKALIWEDEGHSVRKEKNRMKLHREMSKFFKKHLTK
jgi:dipeptidyl aminopeptidase/acylaminoacyl peptidase